MKCICPIHGSSLHTRACRHVRDAGANGPLSIGQTERGVICRDCLTPNVIELLAKSCPNEIDIPDEELDAALDEMFAAYHELNRLIGYAPMCTECLFAATGVDRRRC